MWRGDIAQGTRCLAGERRRSVRADRRLAAHLRKIDSCEDGAPGVNGWLLGVPPGIRQSMRSNRRSDTRPERLLRSALHRQGFDSGRTTRSGSVQRWRGQKSRPGTRTWWLDRGASASARGGQRARHFAGRRAPGCSTSGLPTQTRGPNRTDTLCRPDSSSANPTDKSARNWFHPRNRLPGN
jgi:hypothetical protein